MKKKFRFLSSLALTGMLATGIMGTTLAATDVPTKEVGVYKKLVSGETVVPFVLANREDVITIKDLKDRFPGLEKVEDSTLLDESKTLGTGDKFVVDGKEHTLIVYGDVDGDGEITVLDALAIQKYDAGIDELDKYQLEAANVMRAADVDKEVDVVDALHIQKYDAEMDTDNFIIDETPAPEQEEQEPVTSDYKVTVNDKNIVNNVNEYSSTATVKLPDQDEEMTNVKLVTVDSTGKVLQTLASGKTIPKHTTEYTISLGNVSAKTVEGTNKAKLIQVVDGVDKTLVEFTFEKSTEKLPEVINVSTFRDGTKNATMSFEAKGESDIVKMYYVVKPFTGRNGTTAPVAPTSFDEFTEEIPVTDNKLDNEVIYTEGANNTAYVVYYVLENSDGSRTPWKKSDNTNTSEYDSSKANNYKYVITRDTSATTQQTAVKKVNAPDLTKVTAATFTWDLADGVSEASGTIYKAILFKDDVPVAEKEITGNRNASGRTVDFTTDMKEEGTYKVGIVVKGNATGTTKDSEIVYSDPVGVTNLEKVTNINFEVVKENNAEQKVLSWESDYVATGDNADITGYSIKLYKLGTDGKYTAVADNDSGAVDGEYTTTDKKVALKIAKNTIYKAEISVISKSGQIAVIGDTAVASSEDFFFVDAGTIKIAKDSNTKDIKTADSVTLQVKPVITIPGKTITYSVEVWEVTGADGSEAAKYSKVDTISEIAKEDVLSTDKKSVIAHNLKVTGLEAGKSYVFKVIVNAEGVEGKSGFTTEVATLKEVPAIVELEVSDKSGEGKISKNGATLNIDGVEIDTSKLDEYVPEVSKINDMMDYLVKGDIITLEDNKLTVKLPVEASTGTTADVRTFGDMSGMILELEGNKYTKSISVSKANEVILTGNGAMFNISQVTQGSDAVKKITLQDGVDVTTGANQKMNIVGGSTVAINNVKVSASENTEITTPTAAAKVIEVTANNGSNNLTFENTTTGDATITVVGVNELSSKQEGTIKITSEKGKVTLNARNLNVASEIEVEVKSGSVDLTDSKLGGSKDVKVSNEKTQTSTIDVNVDAKCPIALNNVEIKDYTDAELMKLPNVNLSNISEVKAYLAKFDNLKGKGATITTAENNSHVTITFTGVTFTDASIPNVK